MRSSPDAVAGARLLQSGAPSDRPGYFIAGAGTPVVMLHSSLSSKSQWTALAERLAPRYRVIALDLCGYGDNAVPAAGASFTLDEEVRLVTGSSRPSRRGAHPRPLSGSLVLEDWLRCDSRNAGATASRAYRCTNRWCSACWMTKTRSWRTRDGSC